MVMGARKDDEFWARWLVPSIADLLFIALLGLLVWSNLSVRLLGDAGIGWHIRTGQLILANHAFLRVDPFSSSLSGHPWFAWEWLYDIVVGQLDRCEGLNAVVLFSAFIIALTFSCAFRLLQRRETNLAVALILILLAVSASMIHFFARPHVLTWLFTLLWFWILDSCTPDQSETRPERTRHQRRLWLLPLLMLVWANVHGGFLVGFVLLGIYWLSAVWERLRGNEDRFEVALGKIRAGKRAVLLTQISLLSAFATFVNPYGWKLHIHIYRYLSNRFLMDHIDEFQSPNFHGIAQKCFAMLLLLALVALVARSRQSNRIRASEFLLILFAVYSGLYAARNIPVAALLLILIIGPWLSSAIQTASIRSARRETGGSSVSFFERMQTIDLRLGGHLWPVAAVVFTCGIVLNGGQFGGDHLIDAHFDGKRFPSAAVDYIQQHHVQGPLFAPDAWGGYLIYRLYPQAKVVIDDRHDFYGEEFLRSYLKTIHVEPGWQDFLLQHSANALVVPKSSALANILLETPRWHAIYSGDVAIVFALDVRGSK
jgi:hypothetical protein